MANEVMTILTNNLDYSLDTVHDALPKDFNKARFLQNTIAVIKQNPGLMKFSQNELLACSLRAAYLGLDFMNQEAWLVPFKGHLTFMNGYKGERKLALKYSITPLTDIDAQIVREGDYVDYGVKDGKAYFEWKPKPFNNGEVVGAFAIAYINNEAKDVKFEVMTKAEIEKVRKVSPAGSCGPWKDWWESMARKTVMHKLANNLELDFDNKEQRDAWEMGTGVELEKPAPGTVVDAFAPKTDDPDEANIIDSTATEFEDIPMPDNFK